MSPGKAASQAGHAYLGAFLKATGHDAGFKQQAEDYAKQEPGTKVCLTGTLNKILRMKDKADALGIPNFLVTDSGHMAFKGGEPTVTAFGIGPATAEQAKPLVGGFQPL